MLEMYRQDQFRQDVVHEQAAEIVALEERVREVDRLLSARTSRTERSLRCGRCGTRLYEGAHFCPSCGQALEPQAQG
jgi:rubrerythrin